MAFVYKKPEDSEETRSAREKVEQLSLQKPGSFISKEYKPGKTAQMAEGYLDQYLNRGDFKYDLNGDALFKQYKSNAQHQGKMAMMDTVGQSAAATGGYGNSWAQTAGQQVYNNSLAEVNNVIPELWQMAYDKYNAEGENLLSKYGVLADREAAEYDRHVDREDLRYRAWSDENSDWRTQMEWARDDRDTSIDRDRADVSEENSYAWNQHQSDIQQDQWNQEFDLAKDRSGSSGSVSPYSIPTAEKSAYSEAFANGDYETAYFYLNTWLQEEGVNQDFILDQLEKFPADFLKKMGLPVPEAASAKWGQQISPNRQVMPSMYLN